MPGSTNFLVFDENAQNMASDGLYGSNNSRLNGVAAGAASSSVHNKLYRQVSIMAAAIAQWMANQGQTVSDNNLAALTTIVTNSFASQTSLAAHLAQNAQQAHGGVNVGANNKSTQEVKTLLVDTDTRSVEVTRVSGQISSLAIKDPSDASTVASLSVTRTSGQISSVAKVVGARTVTTTVNRTGGNVTGITKAVS